MSCWIWVEIWKACSECYMFLRSVPAPKLYSAAYLPWLRRHKSTAVLYLSFDIIL